MTIKDSYLASIFLRPGMERRVKETHKSIVVIATELGNAVNEDALALLDLLAMPKNRNNLNQAVWRKIHGFWLDALEPANKQMGNIIAPRFSLLGVYDLTDISSKTAIFNFLVMVRRKGLWQAVTNPNASIDAILEIARNTNKPSVLYAIKQYWLYRSKRGPVELRDRSWNYHHYTGLPAVTGPVKEAISFLFEENTNDLMRMKEIHTILAAEIGHSEIWVNSALWNLGQRLLNWRT